MSDYQLLFKRYLQELRDARSAAEAWWLALEKAERAKGRTAKEARTRLEERWPFGPMSHPWVLGVYRKYFMLTVELNRRHQAGRDAPVETEPTEADWGVTDNEMDDASPSDPAAGETFEDMSFVAPWILLVDALHGVDDKLADSMNWVVYQPIGMDPDDNPI